MVKILLESQKECSIRSILAGHGGTRQSSRGAVIEQIGSVRKVVDETAVQELGRNYTGQSHIVPLPEGTRTLGFFD